MPGRVRSVQAGQLSAPPNIAPKAELLNLQGYTLNRKGYFQKTGSHCRRSRENVQGKETIPAAEGQWAECAHITCDQAKPENLQVLIGGSSRPNINHSETNAAENEQEVRSHK